MLSTGASTSTAVAYVDALDDSRRSSTVKGARVGLELDDELLRLVAEVLSLAAALLFESFKL